MEYKTSVELSRIWGISERRIAKLCAEERIPGAKKIGSAWAIPENAEKPVDARVHSGKYRRGAKDAPAPVQPLENLLNQVFEADCLEKMREIPDGSIDMVLCDLPYGVTQNDWDCYIPLDRLWEQYTRIIKPNGVIVLTSSGIFTAKLILSRPDLFKYKLVWEKSKPTNFLNAKKQPLRKHEDICVFYDRQPTYHPQMTQGEAYDKGVRKNQLSGSYGEFQPAHVHSDGERYPTDIIYMKTAESEGAVVHPTQKPVELGRYLIRTYTNPGDVVLDNTCGSGSFLVAAVLEGRNFIGIEKNEDVALFKTGDVDYVEISRQRVREAMEKASPTASRVLAPVGLTKVERRAAAASVRNNERSEAIQLITCTNEILSRKQWRMVRAGGEATITAGSAHMFPDMTLYGDSAMTLIQQGWELKMPDVSIDNAAFIRDAQRKAETLGLNSCVIWNFSAAVLYQRHPDGSFSILRRWNCPKIKTRPQVDTYRAEWTAMLEQVLADINEYFVSGTFLPAGLGEIVPDTVMGEIITRNKALTADALTASSRTDTRIYAQLQQWWKQAQAEYLADETSPYTAYARVMLLNWTNRLVFAHLLKRTHNAARDVETLTFSSQPEDAEAVFSSITAACGYRNIFAPLDWNRFVPEDTWRDLMEFNAFLTENGIGEIPQSALQNLLERTVSTARRELIGQFTTPPELSELVVAMTMRDVTTPCLDPCCGTGTISKTALSYKLLHGLSPEEALKTVWASDKFSFPLQIAALGLARADAMNQPVRVFQQDLFDLSAGQPVPLTDPATGQEISAVLPRFGTIVSNLPFVPFELISDEEKKRIQPLMQKVSASAGVELHERSDLYTYMVFSLWSLLAPGGRLGVFTSNSWLGTKAGRLFFQALRQYYHVEQIHLSGRGRWFQKTDVVALFLVLTRRETIAPPPAEEETRFFLWQQPLSSLSQADRDDLAASALLGREVRPGLVTLSPYRQEEMEGLLQMRVSLNALFHRVRWLGQISRVLCPITQYLRVTRGERRGWDKLFYPAPGHGIEDVYLKKVLKSSRQLSSLQAQPDSDAFCCSESLESLRQKGHTGALNWILSFEGAVNKVGVPLPECLARPGLHWYEMQDTAIASFVTGMNPDRRLFVSKFDAPAFVNQRLIAMQCVKPDADTDLLHALLNSILGMFYIEAIGFGRGLGVLDINAKNIGAMEILNPALVSPQARENILDAFAPLKARDVLTVEEELSQPDRQAFDHAVLGAFGIDQFYDEIRASLLSMQRSRHAVRE